MSEPKEKKFLDAKEVENKEKHNPLRVIGFRVKDLSSKHPFATNVIILLVIITLIFGVMYFQDS